MYIHRSGMERLFANSDCPKASRFNPIPLIRQTSIVLITKLYARVILHRFPGWDSTVFVFMTDLSPFARLSMLACFLLELQRLHHGTEN